MKPGPSRAATARVLADIDAAVRPVERARTAAAVDRVLANAARGCSESAEGWLLTQAILGAEAPQWQGDECVYCSAFHDDLCDDLEGLAHAGLPGDTSLAPHNVSPHLFPTDPS